MKKLISLVCMFLSLTLVSAQDDVLAEMTEVLPTGVVLKDCIGEMSPEICTKHKMKDLLCNEIELHKKNTVVCIDVEIYVNAYGKMTHEISAFSNDYDTAYCNYIVKKAERLLDRMTIDTNENVFVSCEKMCATHFLVTLR